MNMCFCVMNKNLEFRILDLHSSGQAAQLLFFFNHHALLLLAIMSQFTAGARYLQVSKELGICEVFPLKGTPVGVNLNGS